MKKFSGELVMIIAATTAIVFLGINLVDSMISVIVSLYPEAIEGEVNSLLLRGMSFRFGYHLGIVLIIVGYFLEIGIFCWYFEKNKKEEGEKE
ncbi:hypothetical protein J7K42_01285 [bacterium]|nr:hypothetical protein [bacterium]